MVAQTKWSLAKILEVCHAYREKFGPLKDDPSASIRIAASLLDDNQPLNYLLRLSANKTLSSAVVGALGATLLGTLHRLRPDEPYLSDVSAAATMVRTILSELSLLDSSLRPQGAPAASPVWLTAASVEGILAAGRSLGEASRKKEVVEGGPLGRILNLTEIGGELGNLQAIAARCRRAPASTGTRIHLGGGDQEELEQIRSKLRVEVVELRALKDRGGYAQHLILDSVLASMELIVAILDAPAPADWTKSEADQQETKRLQGQVEEAKKKAAAGQAEIDSQRTKLSNMEKKLSKSESALRDSQELVKSMAAKQQQLEADLGAATTALETARRASAKLQDQLAEQKSESHQILVQLDHAKQENGSLVQAREQEDENLQKALRKISKLDRERRTQVETVAMLSEQVNQVRMEMERQKELLASRTQECQNLQANLNWLRETVVKPESAIVDLSPEEKSKLEVHLARIRQEEARMVTFGRVADGVME